MKKIKQPKIILWDIEILLNLPEFMKKVMETYDRATMKATLSTLINFGYMELGDKKAKVINAWDFPNWDKDVNDDYHVVKAAGEILYDADAIVTHYGSKFDLPFLNSRLLYHGLPVVPKIPHIDTCTVARNRLYLHRNRLNTIAQFFSLEEKLENGGWQLWVDVSQRKKSAQKKMSAYCAQDVITLKDVFLKLRPLVNNIPNYRIFSDDPDVRVCPSCGSKKLEKHGTRATKTKIYQRYRCRSCGSCSTVDLKGENIKGE